MLHQRPSVGSPTKSIIDLTAELVQVPSRADNGDGFEPIFAVMQSWLEDHGLRTSRLTVDGDDVCLVAEIRGATPGPTYVLDATLDTAPFGDEQWIHDPLSAHVDEDGWMWGRGTSDSKAGAAIFAHVGAALAEMSERVAGQVDLVFEVEEHNGSFRGAKAFFDDKSGDDIEAVMIGYPGLDRIVTGCRGFARFEVDVHGVAGHTGSSRRTPANAAVKAADLIAAVRRWDEELQGTTPSDFPLSPKATVTRVHGGTGYSLVPDLVRVGIDVRLTPDLTAEAADTRMRALVRDLDDQGPGPATTVTAHETWPHYQISPETPFVAALQRSAEVALGQPVPASVAGPSNIGNYLAGKGIPATAGFGVRYEGLHAANERIDLATIEPVFQTYVTALLELLAPAPSA